MKTNIENLERRFWNTFKEEYNVLVNYDNYLDVPMGTIHDLANSINMLTEIDEEWWDAIECYMHNAENTLEFLQNSLHDLDISLSVLTWYNEYKGRF